MNYLLKCKACGATCWVEGEEDSESAGVELKDATDWKGGNEDCKHEEFDVVDHEYPEHYMDDVL